MTFKLIDDSASGGAAQPAGDARPASRDEAAGPVTCGAPAGTSGARSRAFLAAYASVALFAFCFCTVNILSTLHEQPKLPAIAPIIWEYSSWLSTVVLLPAVGLLAAKVPFDRTRIGRFLLVHAPATALYSLLHVGGFVLLRIAAYAAGGYRYDFGGPQNLLYEYRKDLLAYVIALTVFTFAASFAERRGAPMAARLGADEPTFDIREGAHLIRTPVAEILAAASAGNYVEFRLADGRRPLMRATLANVEAALSPFGFVRTHRSWLVNPQRVRGLVAEGSGDYRIELDGGVEAPLSRRFPGSLEALRAPGLKA